MKKFLRILLVAVCFAGFTSCMNNDFEEIQKDGIEVPMSTDSDDDDEVDPVGDNPKG